MARPANSSITAIGALTMSGRTTTDADSPASTPLQQRHGQQRITDTTTRGWAVVRSSSAEWSKSRGWPSTGFDQSWTMSPIGPMIGMRPLGNRSNTVAHSERSGILRC